MFRRPDFPRCGHGGFFMPVLVSSGDNSIVLWTVHYFLAKEDAVDLPSTFLILWFLRNPDSFFVRNGTLKSRSVCVHCSSGASASVFTQQKELCVYACVCFCIYLLCHLLIYVKYPKFILILLTAIYSSPFFYL